MDRIFPEDLKIAARQPFVKKAFISDIPRLLAGGCANCGGLGAFVLFLATDGPFEYPFPKKDKTSHWHDGKWWLGKSYEFACPVCRGLGYVEDGKPKQYAPKPAKIETAFDSMITEREA